MKAPPFGYVRASSIAEILDLWDAAGEDAKLLAGGQSLLPTLAFRLSEPSTLIDIARVGELKGVTETADAVRVGALTRHADLETAPLIRRYVPLLAEAIPLIAHPAIRNRGTIGGSLAFADPAAELPACAVALGATIVAVSRSGERRIPAETFFLGIYTTALHERELIVAIEFPRSPPERRGTILELARRSGDYAMAGIAACGTPVEHGIADPRLVFFGVGPTPMRAERAMAALAALPREDALAAAKQALAEDLDPPGDLHGGPEMKLHLCRVLLDRALHRLLDQSERSAA
jgi:aerobic carbon-monoxide dehydrogenase medium subunit